MSEEEWEEKELHLKKDKEREKAKRLQETAEEKELYLKNNRDRAKAKRLQEKAEEKKLHLKNNRDRAKPHYAPGHQGALRVGGPGATCLPPVRGERPLQRP